MDSTFEKTDTAKFGWVHIKTILVAGIGFFCDAYDLFIINLVVPGMIGFAYFGQPKFVTVQQQVFMKGSAVLGTFFGQLGFGILGDLWGRKSVYGISLAFMLIGAVLSAMSASAVRGMSVVFALSFWRFMLGIGIGGDYPLSATISSEYSSVNTRGATIAAVFAMQGVGQLTASIVALVVIVCFKGAIYDDHLNVDYCWRICLGLGTFPAALGAYFRAKLPETPRYTAVIKGDREQAQRDMALVIDDTASTVSGNSIDSGISKSSLDPIKPQRPTVSEFIAHYKQWEHLKVLIGCAGSWFMLDVAFYGLGLNQSIILTEIGYVSPASDPYKYLYSLAAGNCLINIMGSVPGYYVCVALIDRIGRTPLQRGGFTALTVIFIILSAGYFPIKEKAIGLFIFIYCLGQFCFNLGPNTTTFVVPGEVFPTRFRSTSHGICAATGKVGAIVSAYGFSYLNTVYTTNYVQVLMAIFSVFMFLGLLFSFLVPETKGISLEELNDENVEKLSNFKTSTAALNP